MSHTIRFYPVGNGDTCQIILDNGRRILLDYRHKSRGVNEKIAEIDLKGTLQAELNAAQKNHIDVLAFTHADSDHIENSTDIFELDYAKKYQGDGRIKINTLWVPAAMLIETTTNEKQSEEFVIWRSEARHRLKEGYGIRVFSRPKAIEAWLNDNGLTVKSRSSLFVDAGEIVPGFSLDNDDVELFCHSPFIKHVDEAEEIRNGAALIFNIRFTKNADPIDMLAVGDSTWEVMEDIISKSIVHHNEDRLAWDLFNIPHHCSYLALSDEKGEKITVPKSKLIELLRLGKEGAYMVSSSNPIPDSLPAYDEVQPPHIQTRKCYGKYLKEIGGSKFLVTMEYESVSSPKPIEFTINNSGLSLGKAAIGGAYITSKPSPKVGR